MLETAIRKIASLGLPGVMFAIACSAAGAMGLAGGAVITTALAMLGGPLGMVGGLALLGVATLIGDAVSKFGIEAVLKGVYQERLRRGEAITTLLQEIDGLLISQDLKQNLKQILLS